MQIKIASGSTPAFLSKNYINGDSKRAGAMVVTSGDTLKHRLYDGDSTGAYQSLASSDTVTETITIGLYEANLLSTRSIDFIAILNTNIKNFLLEYSANDGSSYTTFIGGDYTVSSLAAPDLILALATPVTANKLRLTITTTQTANAEKSIGEFIAALGTFQPAKGMTDYEPENVESEMLVEMANGTKAYSYYYRADNSFTIYSASVGFRFMTAAERDSLNSIRTTPAPFLFYPLPGDRNREIYLGKMKKGSFKDPFSSMYIGAGYDVSFDFEEIGGS